MVTCVSPGFRTVRGLHRIKSRANRIEHLQSDLLARRPFRNFRDRETDTSGLLRRVSVRNGSPSVRCGRRFHGYRGTGRDVTADVEAAQELELAKQRAEAASRAKSEFLANMDHRLRTPLDTAVIAELSKLIRDQQFGRIGANYVDYATEINTAGHHLLDIINDVLDLSKIEAGRYELAESTVELAMVVRGCVAMLQAWANEGSVQIEQPEFAGIRMACPGMAAR